jgi:methionyl-tRNA formyltransferase
LKLVFAGTPDFAARHLRALLEGGHEVVGVLTQPDRPAGRGKRLQASPVKQLALEAGLPVQQPRSLRKAEARAELAALEPDLLIVVAYGLILPESVLTLPRFGCLNVHASLLPRWRGAAPIQRAIEAGDDETGITIMEMDAGLDTGRMLARQSCPIGETTTAGSLHDELATLGAGLLLAVIGDLPAALSQTETQDDSQATYAEKIGKDDARIDWSRPAAEIARQVRAFNPFPVTFTFLGAERLKIWQVSIAAGVPGTAPGTLIEPVAGRPRVACGDGALILETLQFPGGRALPAEALMRSRSAVLAAGQRFTAGPG